ncbi:hypothetical protein N7462_008278 [Penicillium macrosclerotiorum]|uniref:uncharacterized protein n=1 Tax=Penicillium macrosclerotiorum TaxID=303699 RepID=UPI0025478978|nr:uncharacterized protein N7462_008278 [Penicillium macrosclerotiorum]KAJ5675381.1 hypothetical protein N7462_008278 [Penicillium macrosclerotiorum]
MFEEFVVLRLDTATVETVFYQMRESVMAIYAFVGVPWVVPSCLGIVDVLQQNGLEHIAKKTFRYDWLVFGRSKRRLLTDSQSDPIDVDSLLLTGKDVVVNTYRGVNNNEVRDMLSIGFPEMSMSLH